MPKVIAKLDVPKMALIYRARSPVSKYCIFAEAWGRLGTMQYNLSKKQWLSFTESPVQQQQNTLTKITCSQAPMSNPITHSKLSAVAQQSPSWNNVATTYSESAPTPCEHQGPWLYGSRAIMRKQSWRLATGGPTPFLHIISTHKLLPLPEIPDL